LNYTLTLVTIFAIWSIGAMSLNVLVGYAGQLAVTQGAMVGVGSYTVGILATHWNVNPLLGLLAAAVVGCVIGIVLSYLTLRLRAYDFVLMSLALQLILIEVLQRWTSLTGGSSGLSGVPRPRVFGQELAEPLSFAVYCVVVALVIGTALYLLSRSPFAIALRAFRESESSLAALGFNTERIRVIAGAIAGLGAAVAGALYSSLVYFLVPATFSVTLSILVIVYILVGGSGNMLGVAVGVAVVMAIPQVVEKFPLSVAVQGPVEQIGYGLIILLFVWFRPAGIVPERRVMRLGPAPGFRIPPLPRRAARATERSPM
jgi:branched-chain amino acid transport system permease protein